MPVPDPDYQTAIAVRPPNQVERSPYYRHTLAGGNTYVLDLLQRFGTVLGIEGSTSDAGFEEQIAATRALLMTLALGTPVLSLVGTIGAALTVGLRRGGPRDLTALRAGLKQAGALAASGLVAPVLAILRAASPLAMRRGSGSRWR